MFKNTNSSQQLPKIWIKYIQYRLLTLSVTFSTILMVSSDSSGVLVTHHCCYWPFIPRHRGREELTVNAMKSVGPFVFVHYNYAFPFSWTIFRSILLINESLLLNVKRQDNKQTNNPHSHVVVTDFEYLTTLKFVIFIYCLFCSMVHILMTSSSI